jgi:hypothetical protein
VVEQLLMRMDRRRLIFVVKGGAFNQNCLGGDAEFH